MTHDVAAASGGRSLIRIIVVTGLTVFMLGSTIPNLWTNLVGLPFSFDGQMRVDAVYGSAVEGGLRVGDVADWRACPLTQRMALIGMYYMAPGTSMAFPIVRDNRHLTIPIRAVATTSSTFWLTFIKRASASCFVLTAAVLLLRRPTKMLWGFFLYALGSVNGDPLFFEFLPIQWYAAHALTVSFAYAAPGPIGLWMFASRFPQDRSGGWRRIVDKATLPAFVVLAISYFALSLPQSDLTFWPYAQYPIIAALTIGLLCF